MVRADGPRRDQPADAIPSSSPAFGTAPHPLRSINPKLAAPNSEHEKAIVLPILIPPTTLRPLAFRILTKSHSLTLHSSALQVLATFVGKNCGSRWREDGLASKLLEEVGKTWKNSGGGVIITAEGSAGDMLRAVLHGFEAGMSGGKVVQSRRAVLHGDLASRPGRLQREDSQQSLGMSGLDMRGGEDEGEEVGNDARAWLQVIDAFDCPRYGFSTSKKAFER